MESGVNNFGTFWYYARPPGENSFSPIDHCPKEQGNLINQFFLNNIF